MSGILGIFRRDGALVERREVQRILDDGILLDGEDGNIWVQADVGLGHSIPAIRGKRKNAAAQASPEAVEEQPTSLRENQLTITGDVRLVARDTLCAKLSAANRAVWAGDSDATLLLHAYALWGPDCCTHLSGDFSFAIWDAKARTLFCARDHFGIKPFYYAVFPELFLFSDSLNAFRLHPRVSSALNDSAVADFLLFGLNCDNSTTTFRDIQRLPPAHSLLVSRDSVRLTRYWSVPADGRIRYAQSSDYVENFLEVWNAAIADRLDGNPTGIFLSGGLDSAAVAASAREQASSQANTVALRAFTISNELARNDQDPRFAAELAAVLGIPWELVSPDATPNLALSEAPISTPEPVDDPLFARELSTFRKISAHTSVVLSGEGADNLMHFEMWPYVRQLRVRGEWGVLFNDLSHYAWLRPFPWRGIGARLQPWVGAGPDVAQPFPNWIAPDFAKRLDLHARWRAGQPLPIPPRPHPTHTTAVASLYLPQWTRLFELESPGVTKCHLQVRYPFLDLRVVEYLLAIPPFPWFFQKRLLRDAMAGRVLENVRLRPKTPFPGDPVLLHLQRFGPIGVKSLGPGNAVPEMMRSVSGDMTRGDARNGDPIGGRSAEMDLYINRSLLSPLHGKMTAAQVSQMARPFCFNFWLQSLC